MDNVIHLQLGATGPSHRGLSPSAPWDGFGGRLLGAIVGAIRRELTARELRRLDDRLLRDIGLARQDIERGAGPSRTTVAWDVSTGSHLLGAPSP
jgi:uncharacterized protein YjiS (DUF1127 family)